MDVEFWQTAISAVISAVFSVISLFVKRNK